jgi:hypothetical protein
MVWISQIASDRVHVVLYHPAPKSSKGTREDVLGDLLIPPEPYGGRRILIAGLVVAKRRVEDITNGRQFRPFS